MTPLHQVGSSVSAETSGSGHVTEAETILFGPGLTYRLQRAGRGGNRAMRNPPNGAVLTYYVRDRLARDVEIEIRDARGELVRNLAGPGDAGVHEVVWDLKTNQTAERTRPRRDRLTPSEWEYAQKVSPGRYGLTLTGGRHVAHGFVTVRTEPPKTGVR